MGLYASISMPLEQNNISNSTASQPNIPSRIRNHGFVSEQRSTTIRRRAVRKGLSVTRYKLKLSMHPSVFTCKQFLFPKISLRFKAISRITKPTPGMFVLIWMHFSWWFQIWRWNLIILTFLTFLWDFVFVVCSPLPGWKRYCLSSVESVYIKIVNRMWGCCWAKLISYLTSKRLNSPCLPMTL